MAGAASDSESRLVGQIFRDSGHWVVDVRDAGLTLPVERLGFRWRKAEDAATNALAERLAVPPVRVRLVTRLTHPHLPPLDAVSYRRDRRVGKNTSWYLAYDAVIERVGFGDFSVSDLIRVFDTLPEDVLAIATYEVHRSDGDEDQPEPEDLASGAQLLVDQKHIYLVKQARMEQPGMAPTGRGNPQLWLPVISRPELITRLKAHSRG